jgi:hypothetical protein
MLVFLPTLAGQKGGAPAAPAAPASVSLTGLSYANGDWNKQMPSYRDQVMLCYRLAPTESASQPFTLDPAPIADAADDKGNSIVVPCATIDAKHPMAQRQTVVLAIDARKVDLTRIKVLNFNLSSVASTPINPAPLRPSLSTSSVAALNAGKNDIYYFAWPVQLTGDTIPTLTVNVVYVGPAPGDPRTANTVYSSGGVVSDKGHFYTALREGRSSSAGKVTFSNVVPATVDDGPAPGLSLTWMDVGMGIASGVPVSAVQSWAPGKQFIQGTVIFNPINSHYYVATAGGFSGNVMPVFAATTWKTVTEPAPSVTWQFVGSTNPNPSGSPPPALWTPNTVYQLGQVVNGNPGFYLAIAAGQSGPMSPFPATAPAKPSTTFSEPNAAPALTWTDLGNGIPPGVPGSSFQAWAPSKYFATGSVILFPGNSHYYVASMGGITGTTAPMFPASTLATIPDTAAPGKITWEDVGTAAPPGSGSTIAQWAPNMLYASGQVITDADTAHYYLARSSGQSGAAKPTFPIIVRDPDPSNPNGAVNDGNVTWLDSGTVPPAAVANAGPTDAPVNLVNIALPQVHSLYYFNIATGFAVSNVRNSTFTTVPQTSSAGMTTYQPQQIRGHRNVEPIILFTSYLPGLPLDAESPWKPKNLVPGLSFGFSMANPASSFYVGGSSEIWRNIQLAFGANINTNINSLVPGQVFGASAPNTTSRTAVQPFIGLTLNMNFIASFFGQKF